jgi:PAS domain S-box-containing protein
MNNAALMLILCVIYDTFGVYAITNKTIKNYFTGILVGMIGIIVMLSPWSLQPGVFFDTRWVLLSLCGLFFGFTPTIVAVIIAGSFRLYQGGPGGIVGTVVIVVTAFVGISWKYWQEKHVKTLGWKELYIFGVLVQIAMLCCMLLMPAEMRFPIIKAVAPPILIIYPLLTMIIGLILKRQEVRRETEKELAENRKALIKERGLLRGVINAIPDLIFFKDNDGAYLGCNRSFESFTGSKEQDLLGKTVAEIFTPEKMEKFLQKDKEVFSTEQPVEYEEWVDYPDGRKVLLDNVKIPFKGLDGTLHGLVGISRDITERKLAENKLAAEKERLAVTLRSIGDGVITTDVEGKVVMLNTVAEKLTGWTQEEACGRPLAEIFHIINEQTRQLCENPVTKVMSNGQIVGLANHTALISRDGAERSIADSGAPITDIENNIVGVVLVFRDVTNQIRTEQELLKVRKLESIGLLAGGIAHDFNNILAAILGNINLALFDPNLNNDTKKILSEAEKATIRATKLTQQLLTFAKGGQPVKELSSLQTVIKDSADFVLHGDTVACRYNFPDDLWLVDIDRGQIGQVIQNIVLNGSDAMPEGGLISISCANIFPNDQSESAVEHSASFLQQGKFVEIVIQDQGVGIPANVLDKIFDPYFSTKNQGSGLGLTITHSIINKHGGHISVESTPGNGTVFTLYLPASEQTKEVYQESEIVSNTTSSRARILIMDDEEMVRNVTKTMLTRLGHDVAISENGEEAIQLYQDAFAAKERFDFVIMDLTIPGGIGGKDAVQVIRNLDPKAKVVVSSGYSNDPILAEFEDYGFCAAIVKPYRMQELSRVLRQITG